MTMSSKAVKPKDKNAPKRPMSSYFIFANERRAILKAVNDNNSATEISKLLSIQWRELSAEQKSVYEEYYILLKVKYDSRVLEYHQTPKYMQYQKILIKWQLEKKMKADRKSNKNSQTNRVRKGSKVKASPKPKRDQKNEIKELQFGSIGGSLKLLENGSTVDCDRALFGKEENAFSLNCYQSSSGFGIVSCSFQINSVSANYKCSKITIGIIPLESIPKDCTKTLQGYRLGFSQKNVPNSIGYWYSGHVYYESNKLKDFGAQFKLNDVIKVEMDFNKMRLFFYHNGVKQSSKTYNMKLLKDTRYYFGVSLAYPGQVLAIVQ